MQAIRCELCGSGDIMKQDGFFVCQNCKTKYSIEEARRLIGVVKIDRSEEIGNLLTLARRFYEEQDWAESEKYYELAMRETPNSWEPCFFRAYCHALTAGTVKPDEALTSLSNGTITSLKLLRELPGEQQQIQALDLVVLMDVHFISKMADYVHGVDKWDRYRIAGAGDRMNLLLEQMEEFVTGFYPDREETLERVRKARYEVLRKCPVSMKRGERRKLLARLRKELKV